MGKSLFSMGKSPVSMGKSLFSMGKSPVSMGKSLFSMGKSPFFRVMVTTGRFVSCRRTFQDPQEAAMSLGTEALGRWQDANDADGRTTEMGWSNRGYVT
jgi:hypothetical protein